MNRSRWFPLREWPWFAWLAALVVAECWVAANYLDFPRWSWPWQWQWAGAFWHSAGDMFVDSEGAPLTEPTEFIVLANVLFGILLFLSVGTLITCPTRTIWISWARGAGVLLFALIVLANVINLSPTSQQEYGFPAVFYWTGFQTLSFSPLVLLMNAIYCIACVFSTERVFAGFERSPGKLKFSIRSILVLTMDSAVVFLFWSRIDVGPLRLCLYMPIGLSVVCLANTAAEGVWTFRSADAPSPGGSGRQ